MDYNNYIDNIRDKRELKTPKTTVVNSNKKNVFIIMVTAPHMAHLSIWLIALYPKHIQSGEERIQFI